MIVSVCMITYNHEAYIEQAITSILSQNTAFEYELVVANDCSKDNTHNIIKALIKEHPKGSRIKYINHQTNVGMMKNFIGVLEACSGKYIAICDGDDYWIHDDKLQMQVDFLDKNHNFSIVYTLNTIHYNTGEILDNPVKPINLKDAEVKDLVARNFIPASSSMFRNKIKQINFAQWIYSSPYGDWPLALLLTKNGEKIKCLQHKTLAYRKDVGVISQMKAKEMSLLEANYNMFSMILKDDNYNIIKPLIEYRLYRFELSLIKTYNKNRKYKAAYSKLGQLKKYTIDNKLSRLELIKLYVASFYRGVIGNN